jgi:hypothetical protein
MEKLFVFQIAALLVVSGTFGGMIIFTDIYEDVQSKIVETLCLSCIKLDTNLPIKFTFETANNQAHPEFVIDTLKTKGPILIQYGEKACAACDDMINNIIKPYFELEFDKTKSFETEVITQDLNFIYIYIYIDDPSTSQKKIDSYDVYDIEHIRGFPMFTIITLEYDHGGTINPYFASLYGKFEPNDNYEKMKQVFTEILQNSKVLYNRNIPGFEK